MSFLLTSPDCHTYVYASVLLMKKNTKNLHPVSSIEETLGFCHFHLPCERKIKIFRVSNVK